MPEDFPHLSLVQTESGVAFLYGGGKASDQTKANLEDPARHGTLLRASARRAIRLWKAKQDAREVAGLPPVPPNVPVLLQVDPNLPDIDFLRSAFGFEIVSEQDDGFVIVASEDLDLGRLLSRIQQFWDSQGAKSRGIASVHRLYEDENQGLRLQRLLSPALLEAWGGLDGERTYTVDLGVECVSTINIRPLRSRREDEDEGAWRAREQRWTRKRDEAWRAWDAVQSERAESLIRLIQGHTGSVLTIAHEDTYAIAVLPDSFTVRVRISGAGLRDVVLNYPFLFEVCEPDDVESGFPVAPSPDRGDEDLSLAPPSPEAPRVCIIDSGIQDEHSLLRAAILPKASRCFIPGEPETDTADYVAPGGHGTRVAGAVLFGRSVPAAGEHRLRAWLAGARILDANGALPAELFPARAVSQIVEHYNNAPHSVRVFNHSIAVGTPCRVRHMSSWAAAIDQVSFERDVLFVQAAGNLPLVSAAPTNPGVQDHLANGKQYPEFLYEPASRIANPGQSLAALTVGSISIAEVATPGWKSFGGQHCAASYSRSGPGLWGTLKPDVVELGGDLLRDSGDPPQVGTPAEGAEAYPELVRSTLVSGPACSRDDVGTSFAAPMVTRLVARLEEEFPESSVLLYRALVAHSAAWPATGDYSTPGNRACALRSFGFGVPDEERALGDTPYRVALATVDPRRIRAREVHVFQVPIPADLRSAEKSQRIQLSVSLAYTARPRRTRRRVSGYLSTRVDWRVSNANEPFSSFRARTIKGEQGAREKHPGFSWALTTQPHHGLVPGATRNAGTLQKDWAIVPAHDLPEILGVAVLGHPGWDADSEAFANYSLVVGLEAMDQDIEVYSPIRIAVAELQQQLVEVQAQLPSR